MSYTHLTREERYTIDQLSKKGETIRNISIIIDRSPSTVSRELRRNTPIESTYDYKKAHQFKEGRHHGAQEKYTHEDWDRVSSLLRKDWSPEQITGWLKKMKKSSPSVETIYKHIKKDRLNGGSLYHFLRKKKPYAKRGGLKDGRGQIPGACCIEKRPREVEERCRIGDWEIDTVIGEVGGDVLVTMVERKSRFTLIRKASSKSSEDVGRELFNALIGHKERVLTLTADNGKEFSKHKLTSSLLDCKYYFAHPYASWERGSNENMNGLIRQYFPKKSSFAHLTAQEIEDVQNSLNSRPRKCLDYSTPNEIFFEQPPCVALAG